MKLSKLLFEILIVIGITAPQIISMDRRNIRIVIEESRSADDQNKQDLQAARKRMFRIQLTRTIEEKWMKNKKQYWQQAQQVINEIKKEKYNTYPEVKKCLWEKGQFMNQILTITDPLEQESLIELYAEDYYAWQATIGKHNYHQKLRLQKTTNHAMQNITTLPTSEGTCFAVVKTYQYWSKK